MMHKSIGWAASICFMLSGLPTAIEALQTGTTNINLGTLSLWTAGELLALTYIIPKKDYPLITNYLVNLVFLVIMWYYI